MDEMNPTTGGSSSPDVTATPDFSGKSSDDIAGILGQMNQGGGEPEQPVVDPAQNGQPAQEGVEGENKDGVQVPDKFKNPDGTPNIENLMKSYSEAEKKLGQYGNVSHEKQALETQVNQMDQLIRDLKSGYLDLQEQIKNPQKKEEAEYSEDEIEMIQKNPKQWLEQNLDKKLEEREKKNSQEQQNKRIQDYEFLTAMEKARTSKPEFKALEGDMQKIVDKGFIDQTPEAIDVVYNAALGEKLPQIVDHVKTASFKEGYEKAKSEMKLQVEGGGKDTTPVDINLNRESVDGLTSEQLYKLLPKANDSTTQVVG